MTNITPEKFKEVYDTYYKRLLIFAGGIVDSKHAEDIVQRTFSKLCSQDFPKVVDHLQAWLFLVAKNDALKVKAKEQRYVHLEQYRVMRQDIHDDEISISSLNNLGANTSRKYDSEPVKAFGIEQYAPSPLDKLCDPQEVCKELLGGIGGVENLINEFTVACKLKPSYKRILLLRYVEEKSYQEISEAMNISLNNVGVLMHTVLAKIKKHMRRIKNMSELVEGLYVR